MVRYKSFFLLRPLYNLYKLLTSNRYTIGFAEFDPNLLEPNNIPNVRWIDDKGHTTGWYADPFILSVADDEIHVLVEEYLYKTQLGIISKIIVRRSDMKVIKVEPLIKTGSHLSFPAYFRRKGKVYIYPEQGASGSLHVYEYDEKTGKIEKRWMLNPHDLVDTTICTLPDGEKVILTTSAPNYNGDILDIYSYYDEDCPMDLKPIRQIKLQRKTARGAGLPFFYNGHLYRPAQDCTNVYGEGVEIQEITIENEEIKITPRNLIYSPSREWSGGFHTFNVFENKLIVVDARKKRFPLWACILSSIVKKCK